ncbi:hypothetical protein FGADI_11463 [Fusarium gaditjirri]|uniref:Protein kinase domain-containing protein n=1 Tax=Fusarium gaditjirri TaxID=282569 RepID=A0A8H4SUQ7_9HYPO|nr:hypothetical protein FGADI_11463 [Fusarium gaditjirri]
MRLRHSYFQPTPHQGPGNFSEIAQLLVSFLCTPQITGASQVSKLPPCSTATVTSHTMAEAIPVILTQDEVLDLHSLKDPNNLENLLRSSFIESADGHRPFLPFLILSRILTKTRIEAYLKKEYGDFASRYAEEIGPLYVDEADIPTDKHSPVPREQKTYLKIFALLVLIGREDKSSHEFEKVLKGKTRNRDLSVIRWTSTQTLGLLAALDAIHNSRGARSYGRHGDIKPENILWFETDDEPFGLLVVADFGLSKFHRERSRSNTKNTKVGYTCTYAPPEIDIEGGTITRSSDIWSFGCVLLEMACWLLGGWELCEAFVNARLTEDSSGIMRTDSFFVAVKLGNDELRRFTVKPQVSSSCTNYVHDILDIIERYMIVVRTKDVKRASTGELLEKFKDVDQRVQDDNQRDYIARPAPGPRKTPPKLHIAVEAHVVDREYTYSRQSRLRLTKKFTERGHQSQRQSIRVRQIDDAGLVIREPHSMTVNETISGKKKSSPEKFSNADKKSGLAAAQMIEAKVLEVLESFDDTDTCLVKFLVHWKVPVCVQEELDGSSDLGPILTITGTSSNSLAVCCQDYVSATWKDNGSVFLEDLEAFLVQKLPSTDTQVPREPAVSRPFFMSGDSEDTPVVLFKGSPSQISAFSQFLCWIVATFRLPEPKKTTSSSISFLHVPGVGDKVHEFHISLEELKPLEHGTPGTCWTPLFPSTVMAEGFEVPVHPGVLGLQMPFDAMLELAEIVCDVSLEDDKGNATGIYLDGISFLLYPTAYKALPDRHPVVQWHLKEKALGDEGDRDPAIPPDRDGGPLWAKIPVYDTLRTSIAVLGYCEKAMVQLGTAARRQYHIEPQYSHAEVEKPNIEASLNSLTLGSSAGGAKAEGSKGFRLRTGHKRELDDQKDLAYKQVLRISQNMPVIIYDTQSQNERAWMVSQLSMILELFNIWAQREGLRGIQYATASADGGAAAFNVLANRSYSERIAIEKMADEDPSDIKISGIIKRLYGRIQKTRSINANSDEGARGTLSLGRCTIKGWDWLELVEGLERAVSQRRQVLASRMFGSPPCWLPFTDSIPVFFAQEIGDLIVPAQPDQVCRQWSPLPGGRSNTYLAAKKSTAPRDDRVDDHNSAKSRAEKRLETDSNFTD